MGQSWACASGGLPQATPRRSKLVAGRPQPPPCAQLARGLWEPPEVLASGGRLGRPAPQQ